MEGASERCKFSDEMADNLKEISYFCNFKSA